MVCSWAMRDGENYNGRAGQGSFPVDLTWGWGAEWIKEDLPSLSPPKHWTPPRAADSDLPLSPPSAPRHF